MLTDTSKKVYKQAERGYSYNYIEHYPLIPSESSNLLIILCIKSTYNFMYVSWNVGVLDLDNLNEAI